LGGNRSSWRIVAVIGAVIGGGGVGFAAAEINGKNVEALAE
jgi:hypothetical protein